MKHIISINDFTEKEIFEQIIPGCQAMIPAARAKKLLGNRPERKAIFAFFEPSTRTLGSFVEASRLLGWTNTQIIGKSATSITKRETIADTVRMFATQGADALVLRTKIEGATRFAAEIMEKNNYPVAVQNGGDGTNQHPTQTFLDILTILEKLGRTDNFKIGFFGDLKYGRTVHSLLGALCRRKKISLVLVSAPETALQEQYKKLFKCVEEGESLELLKKCDVIYGARLQEERFTGDPMALARARDKFKITPKILETFQKNVIIMHPMPYVQEFDPRIRRDRRLIIDLQAWHGIPVRMFTLNEGYKNRKKKTLNYSTKKNEYKTVKKMPLNEYFKDRERRKSKNKYFVPIANGTVIDHIPNGLGLKIREFLSTKNILTMGVKHVIEDVPSKKYKLKDVLAMENIFIPKNIMGIISSFAPTVTFNIVDKANFYKIKIKAPAAISGIGACPNQNCVTNHEPEATSRFFHYGDTLRCHYCEKDFTQQEII